MAIEGRGFLAKFVLKDLQQTKELLNRFEKLNYTFYTFSTITRDELAEDLSRAGSDCDVEEVFRRITAWRRGLDQEPDRLQLDEVQQEIEEGPEPESAPQLVELLAPKLRELPAPQPVELPAPQLVELPAPQPVELPVPQPVELPAPQPVELPAAQLEELPDPQPVELPAPQLEELPDPQPVELPAPQPVELPAAQLEELPDPQPVELPAPQLEELPDPQPVELPAPQPVELPAAQLEEVPAHVDDCPNPFRSRPRFGPADLRRLLEESSVGRALLERSLWPLSEPSQRELVGIIAEYHLAQKVKTSPDLVDQYATAIVQLFKKEDKWLYFTPIGGERRQPGGKVYSRIVSLRQGRNLRKKREEEHLREPSIPQPDQPPAPQLVELPAPQPVELPAPQLVELPVPQLGELPVAQIVELPAQQLGEPPAPQLVELPAPQPVELPAPLLVELPAQQLGEPLVPQPEQPPAPQPVELPVPQLVELPAPQPVELPAPQPVELPAAQPDEFLAHVDEFEDWPNPFRSRPRFGTADLRRLLEKSSVGRALLERSLCPLSEPSQRELVSIIAEYHLAQKVKTSPDLVDQYATAIVQLFKKEKKWLYFTPIGGERRHPGGKVYSRIVNLRQSRNLRKKREEEHIAKRRKIEESLQVATVPTAGEDALAWLSLNTQPWGTTLQKWSTSFELRKDDLQKPDRNELHKPEKTAKVLETFGRHYGDSNGYQLIDIDYRMLYNKSIEPLNKWRSTLPKLASYFRTQQYEDDSSTALADALGRADLSEDSLTCIVLTLLNTFLPPAAVNSTFKPTIQYAHREIITYVESEDAIRPAIDGYYATLARWNAPPIAKLVFTGTEAIAPLGGKFYVVYKELLWEAKSAAHALDMLVKMNLVLGLEFSRVSRLVWNFLRKYIYQVRHVEGYLTMMRFVTHFGKDELIRDW